MFTRKQLDPKVDPTSVEQALASIASFTVKMHEITQLFARGHEDISQQLEKTAQRLDRAVEAVAAGEARIGAQIAAFERTAEEARRLATEHERGLIEQLRRTVSDTLGESIRPLKAEVDIVSHQLSDASARVAVASGGFSKAVDTAIVVINDKAERILDQKTESFVGAISGTMEAGRGALAAAAEALDSAAGALTQRIVATAEAEDAKLRTFEALTRELENVRVALPSPEVAAAHAQRIEEASLSMSQTSVIIDRAVSEILTAKNSETEASQRHAAAVAEMVAGRVETTDALAELTDVIKTVMSRANGEHAASIAEAVRKLDDQSVMLAGIETVARRQTGLSEMFGSVAQGIDAVLHLDGAVRKESFETLLSKIEVLQAGVDGLTGDAGPSHGQMREAIAALEVEREGLKRLTIAARMMAKEAAAESRKGTEATSALATRLETLSQEMASGLEELKAATADAARPSLGSKTEAPVEGLSLMSADKQSLQRVLAGFRLLMRDIGGEAARFKDLLDGVAGKVAEMPQPAATADATPEESLRERIDDLARTVELINGKIDALAKPESAPGEDATALSLPIFNEERDSLRRLLIGFRLQLTELDAQTAALRDKIAGIRQPEALVVTAELDAGLLAPLHGAAERIAEGVAETLSRFEQQLTDPVSRLTDVVADNAKLLTVACNSLAAPSRGSQLSVADAVAAMQGAARLIDQRVGQVDQLAAVIRKGGSVSDDSLRDFVSEIEGAAADFRREAGDFLAIGAALSHELEAGRSAATSAAGSRRKSAPASQFRVA